MSPNTKELLRSLAATIIPMFFGSLLFSGILESYKNDASTRKEVMNDFYRPMRETQAECQKTHNNLFLKYGEVADSYQLMHDEFKNLATTDPSRMTSDSRILLESVLSSHTKAISDVKELEGKLETCRTKLFRQYGDLALMTGTHKEFIKLFKDRVEKINALYEKRKSTTQKALPNYDAKELMGMLRNFIQSNFENQGQKFTAIKKIDELVNSTIQYHMQLSENEQEIFKVDVSCFEILHEMFSTEINDRFKRGFIARHFF